MNSNSESNPFFSIGGTFAGMRRMGVVAIFVVPYGMAFGAAAVERGMTVFQAAFMSLTTFTGAAQFSTLEFWSQPLPLISLLLTVAAVNARFVILGAVLTPWFSGFKWYQRWLALTMLSDPNFADADTAFRQGERNLGLFVGGGMIIWLAWILGTCLGGLLGGKIGDLALYGLDVFMAAFFMTMIVGRWEGLLKLLPVAAGAIVAFIGFYTLPNGWNIIAGALAGGVMGVLIYDR